jgi:periplasmic divalent cation tolerance protein
MSSVLVYITAPSEEQALNIGRTVVGRRLAACANVFPAIRSLYWWEGRLNEDGEAVLVLKTRSELVERVTALVKSLHPYTCPCVVALPLSGGNSDFLRWIDAETAEPG